MSSLRNLRPEFLNLKWKEKNFNETKFRSAGREAYKRHAITNRDDHRHRDNLDKADSLVEKVEKLPTVRYKKIKGAKKT